MSGDYIVSQTNLADTVTFVNEDTTLIVTNDNATVITSGIQGPPGTIDVESALPQFPLIFGVLSSSQYISTFVGLQTIDSFSYTEYCAAKYVIYASQGADKQVCELLLVHDNDNVMSVEYANVITSTLLGTFSAEISYGNVLLLSDATSSGITYKMMRTLINN
jgi:hypothetical protein